VGRDFGEVYCSNNRKAGRPCMSVFQFEFFFRFKIIFTNKLSPGGKFFGLLVNFTYAIYAMSIRNAAKVNNESIVAYCLQASCFSTGFFLAET